MTRRIDRPTVNHPVTNAVRHAGDEAATAAPAGLSIAVAPAAAPAKDPTTDRLRQGAAPVCPYCKNEKNEPFQVCKSQGSTPYYTRYKCPTTGCPFRQQIPRLKIAQRVAAATEAEQDFSARPKHNR
jgi:hypothetical protein